MGLREFQERFQAAILDPRTSVTDAALGMKTRPGAPPQQRLGVHHSHFWTRMTTFLRVGHKNLARYLGPSDFAELVRAYISAHPPTGASAREVPDRLAAFLTSEPPWRESPVLAQLAHYDWHWAIAAAGAEEITALPEELEDLEPEACVRLSKRAVVVESWYRFDALDLDTLDRSTRPDPAPTFLLLHKRGRSDRARRIDHREYLALDHLARGATIGGLTDLLRALGSSDAESALCLTSWAESELLVALDQGEKR